MFSRIRTLRTAKDLVHCNKRICRRAAPTNFADKILYCIFSKGIWLLPTKNLGSLDKPKKVYPCKQIFTKIMTLPLEDKEKNMTTRIFCLKNNSPYMLINERSLICPTSKSSGLESSHISKQSSEHKIVHTQTKYFFIFFDIRSWKSNQ